LVVLSGISIALHASRTFFVWAVVWGDRDELDVDRREVGDDAVEVGGVADVAEEAGHAVERGVESEIVEERPQAAAAGPTSQHDLVGSWFGHGLRLTARRRR
jgi:hypothetical protein